MSVFPRDYRAMSATYSMSQLNLAYASEELNVVKIKITDIEF